MYIVVLLVVYRCSACDISLFCLQYVIGHRTRSAPTPNAIRLDCERRPIRLRSLADDFRLGFTRCEYGFLCAKTVPVGAFVGVFSRRQSTRRSVCPAGSCSCASRSLSCNSNAANRCSPRDNLRVATGCKLQSAQTPSALFLS